MQARARPKSAVFSGAVETYGDKREYILKLIACGAVQAGSPANPAFFNVHASDWGHGETCRPRAE